MNQPTPKEKYVLTFPQTEEGEDMKFRFMLTVDRKLKTEVPGTNQENPETYERRLIKALGTLDGIDAIQPEVGRYTIEVTIARTFDPDDVIVELKNRLDKEVLTDIIRPVFVTP